MAFTTAAAAQTPPPAPPKVDQSRIARASEVGHAEFADPGNEKAKRFAAERNFSVGEATSQLKRQAALNMFIDRLKKRHPDKYAFVAIEGDQITVGLTDTTIDIQSIVPPGLANVKPVKAAYSEQGTYGELEDLKRQLSAAGLPKVSVGVNSATGQTEFLTRTSRTELEEAIKAGKVKVDHDYVIKDDEIIATGGLYGGRSYNVDSTVCNQYCNLTTGFSLISTASSTRYVSTAAHAENGRARYNVYADSTYASGGAGLYAPTDMFNYQLDIQYAAPSNTADFPDPYFWDGTSYVTVTNYTYPTANVQFCKFGRMTGKTCGIHDTTVVYSNSTWNVTYLRRIKNNGTGSSFIIEGDSGGVVYYGNWALGWVHGRDASYNLYYTPVDDFKRVQSSAIDLIVYR